MTGEEMNELYGTMISPDARIAVPDEWLPAVHAAMQELVDLPSDVRAFLIVIGIDTDAEGDLRFNIAGLLEFLNSDGYALVRSITDRAVAATQQGSVH